MKYTLTVLGVIVIVGGGAYALVPRTVLKSFFQTGDIPTEEQFSDTIDSALNLQDDGITNTQKEYKPTKSYEAGDTVIKSDAILQAKVLTEKQKEFSLEVGQSVTFRWMREVSKPQLPVTYKLRVWQLMQGQSGAQAMAKNAPVVTKEVTDASEITVSGILTGPCKPPYLCDFVWSVEGVTKTDTSTGAGGTAPSASQSTATEVSKPTETTTDSSSNGMAR